MKSLFPDGVPDDAPLDKIVTGDCRTALAKMPAAFVDLVFADPPFNIDYGYDVYDDAQERTAYMRWAAEWIMACTRVLRPSGSMFVAIGDEYAAEYKMLLTDAGLTMRNWIIWHYTFGPHLKRKFGRDHAHILYFTKHPRIFTFNADDIRIESQRQRDGDPRADPRGRVPGDVWTVPRLVGNANERTGTHPCQMPEAILERVILAASNPGDVVLDPFGGSGTTPAVAKRLGRYWLACELSAAYARSIRQRVAKVKVPDAR